MNKFKEGDEVEVTVGARRGTIVSITEVDEDDTEYPYYCSDCFWYRSDELRALEPAPVPAAPAPAEQLNAAGNRTNVGKTKWTLTLRRMWPALRVACQVTEMGAKKYSPDGWWNSELAEDDTCDAVVRHTMAVLSDIYIDHHGEMHVGQNDPESGLPHWAHGAWNLLALGALRIKQANRGKFEAAK